MFSFFIPDGLIIIETVIGGNKVALTDPVLKLKMAEHSFCVRFC